MNLRCEAGRCADPLFFDGQRDAGAAGDAIGVHLAGMSWHTVAYRYGPAFPGEQLVPSSNEARRRDPSN